MLSSPISELFHRKKYAGDLQLDDVVIDRTSGPMVIDRLDWRIEMGGAELVIDAHGLNAPDVTRRYVLDASRGYLRVVCEENDLWVDGPLIDLLAPAGSAHRWR